VLVLSACLQVLVQVSERVIDFLWHFLLRFLFLFFRQVFGKLVINHSAEPVVFRLRV
jgi:hypothetical protein